MKPFALSAIFAAGLLLAGCGNKAGELYKTAQFEELQNNREHAVKLYEEIERKYPGTEFAKKAQERLISLRQDGKNGR